LANPKAREYFGERIDDFLEVRFTYSDEEQEDTTFLDFLISKFEGMKKEDNIMHEGTSLTIESGGCFFLCENSPIFKGRDQFCGIMIVASDITKKMELERLRKDYIHAITHDLKNPIQVIGLAQNCLDKILGMDPNIQDLLSMIKDESNRMSHLVADMLDSSLIEEKKLQLILEEENIVSLIERVVRSFKLASTEKRIKLEFKCSLDPDTTILVDKDRLFRVFSNLVQNALKYTHKNGEINICLDKLKSKTDHLRNANISLEGIDPDDYILARVEDNGSGIAKQYQEHIFERYVRSGDKVNLRVRGTGLGLAICKEIVERHGRKIWLESEKGKGSTFSFILPLKASLVEATSEILS